MTAEHNIQAVRESVYFKLIDQGFDSETAAQISDQEADQYREQCEAEQDL